MKVALAARLRGGLLSMKYNGDTYFHAYDGNGNVRVLVKADAANPAASAITARYAYDGFGKEVGVSGADADKNAFRFSTKQLDAETGMNYYGRRFYAADAGRWINRDPIEERGGWNIYGMAQNNAISFWDRLGLSFNYSITRNYSLEVLLSHGYEAYTGVAGGWSMAFLTEFKKGDVEIEETSPCCARIKKGPDYDIKIETRIPSFIEWRRHRFVDANSDYKGGFNLLLKHEAKRESAYFNSYYSHILAIDGENMKGMCGTLCKETKGEAKRLLSEWATKTIKKRGALSDHYIATNQVGLSKENVEIGSTGPAYYSNEWQVQTPETFSDEPCPK